MKRKLFTTLLALSLMMSATVPSFASTTNVTIEGDATTIDMSVPTSCPIVFESDGTNTTPDNFTIKNNSAIAGVHLASVEMTGQNNWQLLPASADATELSVNSQDIKFFVGLDGDLKQVVPEGESTAATGSYAFDESDIPFTANGSQTLAMDVERAAFTDANAEEVAFEMVLDFAWNTQATEPEDEPVYLLVGSDFNDIIPDSNLVNAVVFTDDVAPSGIELTNLASDGSDLYVGWTEDTTYYVSSQVDGRKVMANPNSHAMFFSNSHLSNIDLTNLDTSQVTDMSGMFQSCSSLTSLDLSSFVTSQVTNMKSMFLNCSGLTSLDLSSFNTSHVTNMSGMFANCTNLNTIYVFDTFVTTNVDNGTNMFKNCSALIGGNGTTWSEDHVDHTYARIDTLESPGYFTDIADKPAN